jgi:hypothetical protein
MKRPLLLLLAGVAGLGVGGGAAFGVAQLAPLAADGAKAKPAAEPVDTEFVTTGSVITPLVFPDARFAGYVGIEAQLEVAPDAAEAVRARMPLLLHAINLRTFKTPMAAGPDGQMPDLETYRRILQDAAPRIFGAGVVRRVAITQARPA